MTTETMREAVEAALKEVIEGARPREPVTYAMAADAAIRTVLERLREPSYDMKAAFTDRALRVSIGGGYTWYDYARDQWQSMLDAAAREVG